MSKEEIEINSIKNIYSVKVDDYLADPSIGVFAKIDIVFKNNNDEIKTETYAADQKEFNILIKKIYNYIELNNIEIVSNIPTVLTHSELQKTYSDTKVEMDDNTKNSVEKICLFDTKELPLHLQIENYTLI